MFGKPLDSGGRIRYNELYPSGTSMCCLGYGRNRQRPEKPEKEENAMMQRKGAETQGSLSFCGMIPGQVYAGARRSGD